MKVRNNCIFSKITEGVGNCLKKKYTKDEIVVSFIVVIV